MKEQITQAERDQDQADFLVDLERAARSPDASDEWLAGFVRQYYGAQPKPEAISEDVILKRLLNIIIVLGCGLAFLIFGMLAKPESPAFGIVMFGLGLLGGYWFVAPTPEDNSAIR